MLTLTRCSALLKAATKLTVAIAKKLPKNDATDKAAELIMQVFKQKAEEETEWRDILAKQCQKAQEQKMISDKEEEDTIDKHRV